MQYSTAELRHLALEDVLAGPERLHARAAARSCPSCVSCAAGTADAQTSPDPDAFPPVRREKPPKRGQDPTLPEEHGRPAALGGHQRGAAGRGPSASWPTEFPEARLAALDAKWWMISQFDSVVVSMPDGTSARGTTATRRSSATCCAARSRSTSGSTASGRGWRARTGRRCPTSPRPSGGRRRSRQTPSGGGAARDRAVRATDAGEPRRPAAPRRHRPARLAGAERRPGRRLPASLPAQADRAEGGPLPLPGLAAGPAVVLRAAARAVLHVLLRDRARARAAQDGPQLRHPHVRRASSACTSSPRRSPPGPARSCKNKAIVRKMAMPREMFPVAAVWSPPSTRSRSC